MKRKKPYIVLAIVLLVSLAATSRFADTVQLFDQVALMFGGADRTQTGDFYVLYDETTDDRLEVTDGTNTLAHIKDMGTTADATITGDLTVDDITADDITMDALTLTSPLPVASGGTAQTVLDDVVGTAAQVTVTNGADSIIGGDVTLSLPSAVTLPGSLAVTTTLGVTQNTTLTGDIAVNGGDITSTAATLNIAPVTTTAVSGILTVTQTGVDTASNFNHTANDHYFEDLLTGYRNSGTPVGGQIVMRGARGTSSVPLIVDQNVLITRIIARSYDGNSFENSASINFNSENLTHGDGDVPGEIVFSTSQDGTSNLTTAVTINSDQSMVGTGNWSTTGTFASGVQTVTGNVTMSGDAAVNGGDITTTGDLTVTPAGGDATVTGTLSTTGLLKSTAGVRSDAHFADTAYSLYNLLYFGTEEGYNETRNSGDYYIGMDSDSDAVGTNFFEVEKQGNGGSGTALFRVQSDNKVYTYGRFLPQTVNIGKEVVPSAITIVSGVLAISTMSSRVVINGEDGITDNINTITGGATGDIVIFTADDANGAGITFTDTAAATADTLHMEGSRVLSSASDTLTLMRTATFWVELSYANVE